VSKKKTKATLSKERSMKRREVKCNVTLKVVVIAGKASELALEETQPRKVSKMTSYV